MRMTLVAALLVGSFVASSALAEGAANVPAARSPAAYLAVDYPDTARGILAKFALRACAQAGGSNADFEIRERSIASTGEILVRMVDAEGHEISRTVRSTAVCQYGQFAAAYFARVGEQTMLASKSR